MTTDTTFCHQGVHLVWFKRDLRSEANAALASALSQNDGLPVLGLFVAEPDYWALPDTSARQWQFQAECLDELRQDLHALNVPLLVRQGDVLQTLQRLHNHLPIKTLHCHQETGNNWTYQRDKRVHRWIRERGIQRVEHRQFGVNRRMTSRDGWAEAWDRQMKQPLPILPNINQDAQAGLQSNLQHLGVPPGQIPTAKTLGMQPDPCPQRQNGGRKTGLAYLSSFLYARGESYRWAMSKPMEGFMACSRLSPYLTFGAISMAEVFQASLDATAARKGEAKSGADTDNWLKAYSSFRGRLHWHCHFMQKLEDQPSMEWANLHSAYNGLRPVDPDQDRLDAWGTGQTGFPFVDACMRSLIATGFLNFRARAMLVSFASFQLWLDWRITGPVLARLFTDYEPGIHWAQFQMQSGTTGTNSIRIYNPLKQSEDHDPTGTFIRHWVPELSALDNKQIHKPWSAPKSLRPDYPDPIVNLTEATRNARDKVWAVRNGPDHKAEAKAVFQKMGSRAGCRDRTIQAKRKAALAAELAAKQPSLL